MKAYPLVTIGVLCYNTGKFVVESMECIPKQHYPNIEIIIVDDCSTDGVSADLIQKHIDTHQLDCVFIRNTENKGISRNMNYIIGKTNTESKYLTFLCDDLWDDKFLHTNVDILENSKENEILVYSNTRQIDYKTKRILNNIGPFYTLDNTNTKFKNLFSNHNGQLYTLQNNCLLEFLFENNPIVAIGVMVKIRPLRQIGGYSDKYSFEDYPTWFKLSIKGYDFLFYNEILTSYVFHGGNFSASKEAILTKEKLQIKIVNIEHCKDQNVLEKFISVAIVQSDVKKISWKKFIFILSLITKNKKVLFIIIKKLRPWH
ncbi:MAG TPA: glycosyltransferase family 2 protein [Chitinophagales bacterium]|jgi:glycosyltransferase involved in cell wall biosynthesis|nr:glycosyltransferase family 2 protein [Chitinophagales bacterium]HQW77908.1 glycosyltransferase family 2 protein [Chitinophagales bacterium]HRB67617.1 glycosyltransferase family 2 protein [Chitinophagales bacterium]HRB68595.1 glycosyltransferase family 2 protein [Chitinophagales bacterium]